MPLLNDEIVENVKQELANLTSPVRLAVFTQDSECQFCTETRQLVEEIAQLSHQLTAEVYDFVADKEKAQQMGVDKIPAIAALSADGADDHGVRFYGIPSGYEFASLLHAIKLVSTGKPELSEETMQTLAELNELVHFQVFVTPTCPYCQNAVMLAHQLAVASPMVRADMVEAMEFPHLANKYGVMGVPRSVINEDHAVEGALPEAAFVKQVVAAVS